MHTTIFGLRKNIKMNMIETIERTSKSPIITNNHQYSLCKFVQIASAIKVLTFHRGAHIVYLSALMLH